MTMQVPPVSFLIRGSAVVIFAWTVAAQAVTVVGTGDPKVDIPAVQAAVDQGGLVALKGRFSFDAPPTVVERPGISFNGAALGTILISRTVIITGTPGEQGAMTRIEGGVNPFYVAAPGAHVTIEGLHFLHAKVAVIRVVAANGLTITSNRVEGLVRATRYASAILVSTATHDRPFNPASSRQSENISGTLWIANNDIDLQGTADGNFLGITVFAVGKSPHNEADLYVSGNKITNSTERPINIYSVGGRAYVERNVITTGSIGNHVDPSADVIHIVGPGWFLIARNTIDCAWATGSPAGIRLQSRGPDQSVSHAIVMENDVNMAAPDGTVFGDTSAAIEIRGPGEGNIVLNNRIRGRANFALSVVAQNGTPRGVTFIQNDLEGFTPAGADLFVGVGAQNTVLVGRHRSVQDHGSGTVIAPVR